MARPGFDLRLAGGRRRRAVARLELFQDPVGAEADPLDALSQEVDRAHVAPVVPDSGRLPPRLAGKPGTLKLRFLAHRHLGFRRPHP
ncbi:MAG: hypothetical protein AB7G12_06040 [Thermoanaerobaculia bacterium]